MWSRSLVERVQSFTWRGDRVGVFRRRWMFFDMSMDRVLKEALVREDEKALMLRDTCKPLLVPCFDLNNFAPFVFLRVDVSESPSYDFELLQLCRATSVIPSMLKPFALRFITGKTSCLAVDGGRRLTRPGSRGRNRALRGGAWR
ncbi:hypothetical protein RJ640_019308 [Escallonia rubra]|uniref:PNPLA domain-containing protein n=1 Tax=Escallonia rubra TaxID=112253 RepID=A0AA88REY2_9ASTE|nr:hypothetical protein RJ640_019308 [Escallonia rubra]